MVQYHCWSLHREDGVYARRKKSRMEEYLQIVEAERVDGKPRQKMVLYVGRYDGVRDALKRMPRNVTSFRRRGYDAEAEALAERLKKLRALVERHPELLSGRYA